MSNTRRDVQPNWNPTHPRWSFGPMTAKQQARDRPSRVMHARFCNGLKNSRYNLLKKIDTLRAKEALWVGNRYAGP